MNKLMKIVKVAVPVVMIAAPFLTMAVSLPGATNPVQDSNNPLSLAEIQALIERIARFLIIVSIVIAVGAIVWGAIVYVTAGDSDRTAKGRKWIFNGIIGAAVVFAVGIILQTTASLVTRTFFG